MAVTVWFGRLWPAVLGDLDTSFDRILHGMEDGVLPFTVRSKGLSRNSPELLEISLEAPDAVDPVFDFSAICHHVQPPVPKYWSRHGLKSRNRVMARVPNSSAIIGFFT